MAYLFIFHSFGVDNLIL